MACLALEGVGGGKSLNQGKTRVDLAVSNILLMLLFSTLATFISKCFGICNIHKKLLLPHFTELSKKMCLLHLPLGETAADGHVACAGSTTSFRVHAPGSGASLTQCTTYTQFMNVCTVALCGHGEASNPNISKRYNTALHHATQFSQLCTTLHGASSYAFVLLLTVHTQHSRGSAST